MNEVLRHQQLELIKQAKNWAVEVGLRDAAEMFCIESDSQVVWFIAHAHDKHGKGYFLHYYGSDEEQARSEKVRLMASGLDTYLFATDGVDDPQAAILQQHFRLTPVAMAYTVFHETVHVLLAKNFFDAAERQSGYREKAFIDQINEGLAVYIGLELTRQFIHLYFPLYEKPCYEYIQLKYQLFSLLKEWIQIRRQSGNEESIISEINRVTEIWKYHEYSDHTPTDLGDEINFNGAYLALMKRYCWILSELGQWFEKSEELLFEFIKDPLKFRTEISSILIQANRE